MKKISKTFKLFMLSAIIIAASFFSLSFINNDFEISKNIDVFVTLFKQLNNNYVDEIKPGDLMETGIDAMLESLDPYTTFIPESELEDYMFMTTGQYGGIGALIHYRNGFVYISEPYEGSPAQQAGLEAGDKILEVNGKSVSGKTTDEVSTFLKGQSATLVTLLIEREGEKKPILKTLTRAEIKIDNIPYYGILDNDIAYIKISGFTMNAGQEVKNSLVELKNKTNLKGVIIDLRGNSGGLLIEAVNIVNIFVKKGNHVVSTKGKIPERNQSYKTLNLPIDTEIPLTILTDGMSASSSEIVAGAIQDIDRGVIIGQKTYGKGLVQNVVPVSFNSKLKITVAKYYIPSGRCIQSIDYSHKSENGDPETIADSLKSPFKTQSGRIVYDGGGIEPDILVNKEKISNISYSLSRKFLIFDYASKFKRDNTTILSSGDFQVNETIFNDFMAFLSDKEYDYTTNSENILKKLKEATKDEKYYSSLQKEFDALQVKMAHDKKEDINRNKDEIKRLLKNEIVSRYYFQKGRIISSLKDDPTIIKATQIINNPSEYQALLKPTSPLKK